MAKLTFKTNTGEFEVQDGAPIKGTCREAGVLFGCENGVCGACKIEVSEGVSNLSEKTDNERSITGGDPNLRLACQSHIKSGVIKISNY